MSNVWQKPLKKKKNQKNKIKSFGISKNKNKKPGKKKNKAFLGEDWEMAIFAASPVLRPVGRSCG